METEAFGGTYRCLGLTQVIRAMRALSGPRDFEPINELEALLADGETQ